MSTIPAPAVYSDWLYGAAVTVYLLAALAGTVEFSSRGTRALSTGGAEPPSSLAVAERRPGARTRADRFGRVGVALLVLGCMLHLASIALRGTAVGRWPMGNMYEYVSAICVVSIAAWLIALRRTPRVRPLGVFVVPVVLALLFLGGTLLHAPAGPVVPSLDSYWMIFHVSTAVLSSGLLLLPGAASCGYLVQRSGRFALLREKLPDAEALDRLAYRGTIAAFPLYTFGLICGAIWAESAWGRFWGWDPKETVAFVAWVLYAAYLHARATAGWRAPRAAWINVAGFSAIVFNLLFVNLVVAGLHSYAGV